MAGSQTGTPTAGKAKWRKLKGCKELVGTWNRYLKFQKEFDPTPEHIQKHGVSARGLLSVINEEQFVVLKQLWDTQCGEIASPQDFLFLFQALLINLKLFDKSGRFLIDGVPRKSTSRLPDLDNYIKALYVAVDVAKNGCVVWDDFMNFLIDNIMHDPSSNNLKQASRLSETSYNHVGKISLSIEEHKELFTSMRYYPGLDKVVAVSKKKVSLLDCDVPVFGEAETKVLEHDSAVLNTEYIPNPKLLLTATSDFRLRAWNISTESVVREATLQHSAKCMTYAQASNRLFIGDRQGLVITVDFDKFMTASFKPLFQIKAHTSSVTDMVALPNDSLITVGLDNKIQTVSLNKEQTVTEYDSKAGHKHGVYSVSHVDSYHFLITSGIEPYALIWVDNMPAIPSFRLSDPNSPHAAPLGGVCLIPNTPHVITVDTTGVTKIFDIRTFQMLESFNVRPQVGSDDVVVHSVVHTGNKNRHLVYGSKQLYVFEHESKSSDVPRMAHVPDCSMVACYYLRTECLFLTASTKEVRLWNADSGALDKTFSGLTPSSIAALVVDDRKPCKMLVGNTCGTLTVVSIMTGTVLRTFKKHASAITAISFSSRHEMYVAVYAGGHLCVWYDLDPPIALRAVLPKIKKPVFSTFTDEINEAQHPFGAISKMFLPRKTGEKSDATSAAVSKFKKLVSKSATEKAFLHSRPQSPEVMSPKSPYAKSPRRKRSMFPIPEEKNRGVDAVAKLSFSVDVRDVAISPTEPQVLVTCVGRSAYVYSLSIINSSLKRLAKMGHPQDTELCCGKYCLNVILTGDTHGAFHIWANLDVPVCLCRWYASNPPKAMPRSGVLSEDVDSGDESSGFVCSQARNNEMAKKLLASLLDPTAPAKPSVVPTVSSIAWYEPCYMYVANELGTVTCWDMSVVMRMAGSEDCNAYFQVCEERPGIQQEVTRRGEQVSLNCHSYMPNVVLNWQAHEEGIVSILVLSDPVQCVITCGYDMKVHIWAMDGSLMTSLRQGPLLTNQWCFTLPRSERGKVRLRTATLWARLRRAVRAQFVTLLGTTCVWTKVVEGIKQPFSVSQVDKDVPSETPLQSLVSKMEFSPRHTAYSTRCDRNPIEGFAQRQIETRHMLKVLGSPRMEVKETTSENRLRAIVEGESKDRRDVLSKELTSALRRTTEPQQATPTIAVLKQLSKKTKPKLDVAALGYVGDSDNMLRLVVPRGHIPNSISSPAPSQKSVFSDAVSCLTVKSIPDRIGGWAPAKRYITPSFVPEQGRSKRRQSARPKPLLLAEDVESDFRLVHVKGALPTLK